jgi:hypothetical protein
MIASERVDAVVPGGLLGLELADELECLRPFGMANPQPTLLVPAARFQHVAGMGEEGQHSRFTLVTAGGARSRGVAFGSPPRVLATAQAEHHDIALRLERNRWNGMVEPRVILRALCATEPGQLRVLGEDAPFWERFAWALAREEAQSERPESELVGGAPAEARNIVDTHAARAPVDRRGEGFAGVAGDLFRSGEDVLVAVADVERRRSGLERLVAGLAPDGMPVASWAGLQANPDIASGFDHLVALDPPPRGVADPLLGQGPRASLAWGPAEVEFALLVWRAELDLRPALAEAYRALRDLPPEADSDLLRQALRGSGRYARTPEQCARIALVLSELGVVELVLDPPGCCVNVTPRRELDRSPTFRLSRERLAMIERALEAETRPLVPAQAA